MTSRIATARSTRYYDTRWYLEHFVDSRFKVTACLVQVFVLSMMRRLRAAVAFCADVYRSTDPGRYPALLMRTPYNKTDSVDAFVISAVRHGDVVALQNVRGYFRSAQAVPATQTLHTGPRDPSQIVVPVMSR
jgi:predicted acyl esterase